MAEGHRRRSLPKYFGIIFENQLIGDIELDHIAWRSGDAELRIRIGRKDLWNRGLGLTQWKPC